MIFFLLKIELKNKQNDFGLVKKKLLKQKEINQRIVLEERSMNGNAEQLVWTHWMFCVSDVGALKKMTSMRSEMMEAKVEKQKLGRPKRHD